MGCRKVGHNHEWPEKGILIIQSCEKTCNFCALEGVKKKLSSASTLRDHVRSIHIRKGPYKKLTVSDLRDEERAASEPPDRRCRASKRDLRERTPTPGPSKRRREVSPASVDSGAYCGIDSEIKREKSLRSLTARHDGTASLSTTKKRQKTTGNQPAGQSAEEQDELPQYIPSSRRGSGACTEGSDVHFQGNHELNHANNEYAFVTLAKARPTALSFEPAFQEVVGDLLASLTIGVEPAKLTRRMNETCKELQKAEAEPERVQQIRSMLQRKLCVHLSKLVSAVSSTGQSGQGMISPPTSVIATPSSREDNAIDWSPPQTPPSTDRTSDSIKNPVQDSTEKVGKLKRFRKRRGREGQKCASRPGPTTALTSPASTASAAALTAGPQMNYLENGDFQIRHDFNRKYWSQPTFISPQKHSIPGDISCVLLPFGTPDLPFTNAKAEEVQTACAKAFVELKTYERFFPWGDSLWVATFTNRADASTAQRTTICVRDVPFRPVHLSHGTSKTFRTDFFSITKCSLQELAKAFFDACKTHCGPSNQVQLRLLAQDADPRGRLNLIAYFDVAPELLRFYIPVRRGGETTFMLKFVPMDFAKDCWLCKVHHGTERCAKAMIVQTPA